MADNVVTPYGTLRSDDVGSGVQEQYIKLDGGGDGVHAPLVAATPADGQALAALLKLVTVPQLLGASSLLNLQRDREGLGSAPTDYKGVAAVSKVARTIDVFNALAVTTTALQTSNGATPLDVSWAVDGFIIQLFHTLDQPITRVILYLAIGAAGANLTRTYDNSALSVPAGATLNTFFYPEGASSTGAAGLWIPVPQLAYQWTQFMMAFSCAVAPTTGTVSVKLRGRG